MTKKVLVIKLGALGDIIHSLPMLLYLKQHSDLKVVWIVGKGFKEILTLTSLVDEIFETEIDSLSNGSILKRILAVFKIWKFLGFKYFDQIIVPYRDFRYKILTLWSRSKKRSSFFTLKKRKNYLPDRYFPCEYLRLATGVDGPQMQKPLLPKIKISENHIPKEIFSLKSQKGIIALAPGGANTNFNGHLRKWPISNYVQLGKILLKEGFSLIITGSKEDLPLQTFFSFSDQIINLIGKTTLAESLAVFQKANFVVTHDCGSLHLAKLSGTKVIGLFGPTNPYSVAGQKTTFIWGGQDLPCRPCFDGKLFAPQCKDNLCMKNITPNEVVKIITQNAAHENK